MTRQERVGVLTFLFVQLFALSAVHAQSKVDSAAAGTPIYKLRADFVVPESPAFKLLSIAETSILRPGSVRELALSASGFAGSDGSFSVPTQLGIEAAPFLLLQGRELNRGDYDKSKRLYRTRISVASKISEKTRRPVGAAFGIRGTIVDHADVRLDDTLAVRVLENLKAQQVVYVAAATRINPRRRADTASYDIPLSPDEQEEVDRLDKALGQIIATRQEEQWNATSLEVAAAASGFSKDVEGASIRLQEAGAWMTWSLRAGQHGQFLLGAHAASRRDSVSDDMSGLIGASSRLYFGTHGYKAFIEADFGAERNQKYAPWFLNSGGELRLANSIWAEFSAGVSQTAQEKKGQFVARFKLHTALPTAISAK